VATETLTEDFHTTMRLHRAGWRSAYHNEVLARGLAAGGPDAFYAQRRRWGRGAMQVLRTENPLTVGGLSLGQRLGYLYSLSAWFDSWRTLGLSLVPVAVLATGLFPVAAPPLLFLLMAGSSFLVQQAAMTLLGRGFSSPVWSLLFDVIRMSSNLAATLSLLVPGTGRFAVTAKGRTGDARRRARVPRTLRVLAAVLTLGLLYAVLTLAGLTPTRYPLSATALVPLFWLAVALGFVVAAIRRVRDPAYGTERRDGHRFLAALPATVDGAPARVLDVSLGGVQVELAGAGVAVGEDVELAVAVPDRAEPVLLRATVRSRQGERHRLQFVGRQWTALAGLSATAFGAGAARWAPAGVPAPRTPTGSGSPTPAGA
jgi:cellulose synthase (UDP-forming)